MSVVATGTVTVRSLEDGSEWDVSVTVHEKDIGIAGCTVGDAARRIARHDTEELVETLGTDLS